MTGNNSIGEFEASIEQLARQLNTLPVVVTRHVVLKLYNGLTLRSPVDTGRFRASWQIGVGHLDPTVAPASESGTPGSVPTDLGLNQTKALFLGANWDAGFTQLVFITNSLPYAEALAGGHSNQAPGGWIDRERARVEAEVESEVIFRLQS